MSLCCRKGSFRDWRFLHPGFAILKPAAFLASQAFLGLMLGLLATFLVTAARRRTAECSIVIGKILASVSQLRECEPESPSDLHE